MNKSNNERYKLTDLKIKNAFLKLLKDKDFNSIYVNDICKEANISRTSFYSHYDDINDLIIKIKYKYHNDIINILLKEKLSSKDSFIKYFYYLKDHLEFFKVYLMTSESSILRNQSHESTYDLYYKLIQKENRTEREIKYHMIFIGAAIKAIACKWLIDGCIETPEEMAEIVHREYENFS